MKKKFSNLWDRIPKWLKQAAIKEEEYKNIRNEEYITLPDPSATEEVLRVAVAYLYINEKKSDSEKQSDHVVGVYWKDQGGDSDLFTKSFTTEDEARETYDNIKEELLKIQTTTQTDYKTAKDLAKTFFDKYSLSSPGVDVSQPEAGTHSMSTSGYPLIHKFAADYEMVDVEGKPHVYFGFEFLQKALNKTEAVTDFPAQLPEIVYHTTSKIHCGLHNYIVSYWKKTLTREGNIIRNIISIERNNINYKSSIIKSFQPLEGKVHEQLRLVRKGLSLNDFDKICNALTPDSREYGLFYDKGTGKWLTKTAKAIIQNIFFDTVDELLEYQKSQKDLTGDSTKGKFEELLPEPKEGKESPVTETPSSISFEEAENDSKTLESVPFSASSSLTIKAKLKPEDINEGDFILFRSEGDIFKGKVIKKYEVTEDNVKIIKFDLERNRPSGGVVQLKGCYEEEGISYFQSPQEYAEERHKEIQYNIEKSKEKGLKEDEYIPPSEELETRIPISEEKEEIKEEEDAEEKVEPEEEAPEGFELVDIETSLNPLSPHDNILKKAALGQWIEWPAGLPTIWMKKIYKGLPENFRGGEEISVGMPGKGEGVPSQPMHPGLRAEVKALAKKKQKSDESYKEFEATRKSISEKTKEIESKISGVDREFVQAEAIGNKQFMQDASNKKDEYNQQLINLEEEFKSIRNKYRREYVDDIGYREALIGLFYKYAPLAAEVKPIRHEEDEATVANTSKKLREVLQKEKEVSNKIKELQRKADSNVLELENTESTLWEMFSSEPDYASVAAVQQRINHIDSYFSDYLVRNPSPSMTSVEKFQDTITNLEKEKEEIQKSLKNPLPEEKQKKVDELIKKIHNLRDNLTKGILAEEFKELDSERSKIEDEKYELQDQIGVIATAKMLIEIK